MEMKKYLRFLSYENACKVIDFVNTNDPKDYAHIVVGGVSMQVAEQNWEQIEAFIKALGVRYEVGEEAPHKVVQKIVEDLRRDGVIE
jgi:hypothetical protein